MSEAFNPLKAVALLRAQRRAGAGRRLTRTEQYRAFALVKSGVTHSVISKMFGLSPSSISHLANCLAAVPGGVRYYPDVAREWVRLGEEEYLKAYVLEEDYLKSQRVRHKVGYDDPDDIDRMTDANAPSNPRADSCCYDLIGSFEVGNWRARIDWMPCGEDVPEDKRGPIGWRYADVSEEGGWKYQSRPPHYDPVREDGVWMPWRTSGDCFDFVHMIMGLKSPRRPGRPARK